MGTVFGINSSDIQYNAIQSATNNFISTNNNTCITWTNTSASNNTIIINGSKVGDVEITATGETDITCVINQGMQQAITNQFASQSQQKSKPSNNSGSLFNIFNYSDNDQTTTQIQTVINNITQVSRNTCGSTSQQVANNNFVVVNSSKAGDVGISADSFNSATCALNNMINQGAYNDLSAQGDQLMKPNSIFKSIIILVVIIIVIVIIIAVILFAVSSKKKKSTQQSADSSLYQELDKIVPPS